MNRSENAIRCLPGLRPVLGDSAECSVAVVGQSFVLGDCYQAVGESPPQELGGNHLLGLLLILGRPSS